MGQSKVDALCRERTERAELIAKAGLEQAIWSGALPQRVDLALSEVIVLGLLRQRVRTYIGVFGHGSTEVGEVLRVYEQAGVVRMLNVRNETAASHAATALRWVTGEKAAVVTSIGPGAMHAIAGSLAPLSNGIGVWYLLGDETTEDEGPNMQQIPKYEQHPFLRLCAAMGEAYELGTPASVTTALRRGLNAVDHPHRGGPFFLLLPMNTQAAMMPQFNLDELPVGAPPPLGAAADDDRYAQAAEAIAKAKRVVVRVGGGARGAGAELAELLELADAAAVTSPLVSGAIPYDNPRNMTVGGSKGSLCGNYAMDHADLLVAVGTRFVCQSDSSRTGYPKVNCVVNINTDVQAATHYGRTLALVGDAKPTLARLNEALRQCGTCTAQQPSAWYAAITKQKRLWEEFKAARYATPTLHDPVWGGEVLTQPAALRAAIEWAKANDVVAFCDAGDVQANAFQIVEDDRLGRTFTDTGASYMGFAVSALMATAMASEPFYGLALSGDGSFTMSPQILIDGVEHGARGCVLLFDNRSMAAISGLQDAQYGHIYATGDSVEVDYVAWAASVKGVQALSGGRTPESLVAALDKARAHDGLSLIHVPVYFGPNELGGLGAFGRWNVGNWCGDVQALRHDIGL